MPTHAVIIFVIFAGFGILLIISGFRQLSISREKLWIRIIKRNTMLDLVSPSEPPESAIRNYRAAAAAIVVVGIAMVLLPLWYPLFLRLAQELFFHFLYTKR
jgi:hypothetical protein